MIRNQSGFLHVSESLLDTIIEDIIPMCKVLNTEPRDFLPLVLDESRYDKMIFELIGAIGDLKSGKMLEVGAGYGAMIIYARQKYALDVIGIEPGKDQFEGRYEIAQKLLAINGLQPDTIQNGIGEALPFENETFDVVFSFQVLEHVSNPFQVLMESWRVLKPGGILYINAPNYNTFFEGHYNIFWIPGISKRLARLYLRLLRKNPDYIGHINFLSPKLLKKYLLGVTHRKIREDLGARDWQERMITLQLGEYANPNIKNLIEAGRRVKLLHLMAYLGKAFGWQDTLRISIRK